VDNHLFRLLLNPKRFGSGMLLTKHIRGLDLDGMDANFKIDRNPGSPKVVSPRRI
jgi:hypothetical protein